MIPTFLQLNGVTKINRHEMISRAKEAIIEGGGNIHDFHLFSNTAICINFEVSARNVEKLSAALRATNLCLNRESQQLLADCCEQLKQLDERTAATDIPATLNIIFVHDEPDLRIEVPPIPG